jgi:site-specific recombinase XerC
LSRLRHGAPAVKQQLAAVRMLFDWLVTGQVVPMNPAAAVRGPKHVVKTGKTPVLDGGEWRKLIDSIPTVTVRDLRDRALIATLTYSFARITAALRMKVEDLRPQGASWQVQLHEKGGKQHAMPCHHALAEALRAYIDAAGIAEDGKGWLFRTSPGHNATMLTEQPMNQADAWRMIRRRAAAAGIMAPSAITPSARPVSLRIFPTAARWNMRRRWRRMKAPAPRSSTTARRNG